jgi:hypothetical protein
MPMTKASPGPAQSRTREEADRGDRQRGRQTGDDHLLQQRVLPLADARGRAGGAQRPGCPRGRDPRGRQQRRRWRKAHARGLGGVEPARGLVLAGEQIAQLLSRGRTALRRTLAVLPDHAVRIEHELVRVRAAGRQHAVQEHAGVAGHDDHFVRTGGRTEKVEEPRAVTRSGRSAEHGLAAERDFARQVAAEREERARDRLRSSVGSIAVTEAAPDAS